MPTTGEGERDEREGEELPSRFLIFTDPGLDHDEDKACEAGAEIENILRAILHEVCDLEDIERALREAEGTSSRARCARGHLRRALSESDGLDVGVSEAWDALTFHWGATTTLVSR